MVFKGRGARKGKQKRKPQTMPPSRRRTSKYRVSRDGPATSNQEARQNRHSRMSPQEMANNGSSTSSSFDPQTQPSKPQGSAPMPSPPLSYSQPHDSESDYHQQSTGDSGIFNKLKRILPSLAASDENLVRPILPFTHSGKPPATTTSTSRNSRSLISGTENRGHVDQEQGSGAPGAWPPSSFESDTSDATVVDSQMYGDDPQIISASQVEQEQKPISYGFSYSQFTASQSSFESQQQTVASSFPGPASSFSSQQQREQQQQNPPSSSFQQRQQKQEQQDPISYGFSYSQFSSSAPSSFSSQRTITPSFPSSQQPTPQSSFNQQQQSTRTSHPRVNININPNTSFPDILVYRPLSTFSFHAPASKIILPCTRASPAETMRLRRRAAELLSFAESEAVFDALGNRIERMVSTKLGIDATPASSFTTITPATMAFTTAGAARANRNQDDDDAEVDAARELVTACTVKLRNWLRDKVDERVELGECRPWLLHEVEWASWFADAAASGVLHVKVGECECRPSWEDDNGEWAWFD